MSSSSSCNINYFKKSNPYSNFIFFCFIKQPKQSIKSEAINTNTIPEEVDCPSFGSLPCGVVKRNKKLKAFKPGNQEPNASNTNISFFLQL